MSLTPLFSFIGFNAEYLQCKGVCHDSQTGPLDAPLSVRVDTVNRFGVKLPL